MVAKYLNKNDMHFTHVAEHAHTQRVMETRAMESPFSPTAPCLYQLQALSLLCIRVTHSNASVMKHGGVVDDLQPPLVVQRPLQPAAGISHVFPAKTSQNIRPAVRHQSPGCQDCIQSWGKESSYHGRNY